MCDRIPDIIHNYINEKYRPSVASLYGYERKLLQMISYDDEDECSHPGTMDLPWTHHGLTLLTSHSTIEANSRGFMYNKNSSVRVRPRDRYQ